MYFKIITYGCYNNRLSLFTVPPQPELSADDITKYSMIVHSTITDDDYVVNGCILQYRDIELFEEEDGGNACIFEITDLLPGTQYDFTGYTFSGSVRSNEAILSEVTCK